MVGMGKTLEVFGEGMERGQLERNATRHLCGMQKE